MGSVLRSDVRRSDFLRVVQTASAGDSQAVDKLVAYCLPQIASYLGRRGAAHPEALANQVLAEFVGNLSRLEFKSQERVWSYLYSVARSRLLDEKRIVRLEQPTECIDGPDARSRSFDDAIVNEMWVSDLLSNLTDDQRRVVELRYREDLTLEETAKRTGKTLTAVKGLQRRALAALAAAAAIAAAVILVMLAVRFLQNPGINVQSLQPAGGPEQGADDNNQSGTGEIRTQDGTTTTLIIGQGSGSADLADSPVKVGGRPMQEPLPVDDGTGLPTPSTTAVPTPSTSSSIPATTSTTVPASTTTVATAPPPPPALEDDRAGFVSAPGHSTWVDIDVLANDLSTVDPTTLRIVTPFSAGFGEVIQGPGGPFIRFHATGPGAVVGTYEACEADTCYQANVTISQTWYTDYANTVCDTLVPTIVGTDKADVIVGTPGNDVIFGLGGNDDIEGRGGNDIICGGGGNDVLFGGDGDDIMLGGHGDDDIDGDAGADSIYGGEGEDYIYGGAGADQLFGGAGNDDVLGGQDSDAIFGEAGDDRLVGGNHKDTIFGGLGSDLVKGSGGSDLIKGGPGADTLRGGEGADRLVGNPAEDDMSEGEIINSDGSSGIDNTDGSGGGSDDGDAGYDGADGAASTNGVAGGDIFTFTPNPVGGSPSDYFG